MKAIKVRQGETFKLPISIDNVAASTITFSVWDDGGVLIEETANVVDGVAVIDAGLISLDVGTYSYGLSIEYSDGQLNTLPDVNNCKGDCAFPDFIVCEGIPEGS